MDAKANQNEQGGPGTDPTTCGRPAITEYSIDPPIDLMERHAAEKEMGHGWHRHSSVRGKWKQDLFRQGHMMDIMEEPYADCMRTETITTVDIRRQGAMVAVPVACPLTYACVLYYFSDSSALAGHLEEHNASANHK